MFTINIYDKEFEKWITPKNVVILVWEFLMKQGGIVMGQSHDPLDPS